MFYLKANTQALQLNLKRSPQVPQWINTDEPKLRQILINLLSNAIKFINRGGSSGFEGISKTNEKGRLII
jgi:signal transduction histidine kinase